MFIQVIEGKTSDPEGFRRVLEERRQEVIEGAIGFLGATSVIAPDRTVVTMARFESEEKAMQNSARPETASWAEELRKYTEGEPTYHNCTEVDTFLDGGSNDAGFVQIMIGTAVDKAKARAAEEAASPMLQKLRPDVLGGVTAWDGDWYCQAIYFTSEADAREGEKKFDSLSGEDQKMFQEMMEASGEPRYIDGPNPILA